MSMKSVGISRFTAARGSIRPCVGSQPELHREDVLTSVSAEHEDGDADAEQRDDRDDAVDQALGVAGGEPPERDAERRPRRSSPRRSSSIVAGNRTANSSRNGPVVDDARAEVAVEQLAQVVDVLLPQRLVETQVLAQAAAGSGAGVLAEDRRGRVTREQVDEREQDDGQPEQDRDRRRATAGRCTCSTSAWPARRMGLCPRRPRPRGRMRVRSGGAGAGRRHRSGSYRSSQTEFRTRSGCRCRRSP